MRYIEKKVLIMTFVVLGLYFSSANVVADPVVENISTDPTSPAPLSTITVTANINGEDISSVNLTVSECDETVCFIYNTYPMSKSESGDWVAKATLHDDSGRSTHIKYVFDVIDGGVIYPLTDSTWRVDLAAENGDQNGNGGDGNSTPGFERIYFLIPVATGLLLHRNKRSR